MTDGKRIIYQRYLFKLSGSDEKRKSLKPKRNSWKQKYFIVYYQNDALILSWFDKKPSDDSADPKGKVSLLPSYRLTKLDVDKHACEIVTQLSRVCVASNDQTTIDELVYYLQTQTCLKPGLQGVTYTVFPENSADLRRLGCIGNVCALHISPSGLSLIIQESRSLVSQWPLRCIRTFEASGKGNFSFEAGRHAPFGPGVYEFQTRRLQDQEMYDLLDHYVLQATSDSQAAGSGSTDVFEEIVEEYNKLKRLTVINTPASIASSRQAVRNSGLYDHIYNHDRSSGDITNWMATADMEGHDGPSDNAPPALPPRPPLGSMSRPGLTTTPSGLGPDTPPGPRPATPPGQVPGGAEYEEPDRLSPLLVDSAVPPLPPRNPKRNSRPVSQLNQYEDPDAVSVQTTSTNNYQDIDEIIDSLPPAPPPPSFTPPTPPGGKSQGEGAGPAPAHSLAESADYNSNNYEEIPTMPPPPVPMDEWEYSEPCFPPPVINTYEDLDQLPCPLQAAPSSPDPAESASSHYLPMTRPAEQHEPPTPQSPPPLVEDSGPDGDMYYTMYDREPIVQPPTVEITREKPATAPKPKPNVMPKPTSEKIASLRSKFEDVNVRKGHTKTQSMFEYQPERPKLAKKQSLPKLVDDEGLYLVCAVNEGARLTLPSEVAGPSLCPPRKGVAGEPRPQVSSTSPSAAAAAEDDYLDMIVPVASGSSQQDLYLDMSPGREAATPDGDLYLDMSSPQTSPGPGPAFHVSTPEQVRKLAADDAYLDMGPVPAVSVTAPADEPAPGTPGTPGANSTPLPFDVMNLTQFQTQVMLSRSTDGLDLDSDEDDTPSRLSLPGPPAFQRSLSNPALSDDKVSRSRLSNFLYGTLRIKGRKKKKKEAEEDEQRDFKTGESKFQKNKAYRASTGRAHKKYNRDIKVASNARSFVKSPAAEPQSRRATFGGDLDVDTQIQLRDHQLARPDGPSYDVMSLGRRRPKHAVSTPNLL